jgi:hypothetical protein
MKMSKNNLPIFPANIKVGSQVMVVDGSYTLSILPKSNKMEHKHLGLCDEVFTVIAINVPCPTAKSITDSLISQNNCIISDEDGGIHFVSEINIKNIQGIKF